MRGVVVPVVLIAAGAVGIIKHAALEEQWAAMFPDSPARQTALARCYDDDHLFNRFSAEARSACYQKWLQVTEAPGAGAPTVSLLAPNAVDQQRVAGASAGGYLPQNDIRSEAVTARYRQVRQLVH